MTEQERDSHGRYAHEDGGVIAQDPDGTEWSICTGCGNVRKNGKGRWLPMGVIPVTTFRADSHELFWPGGVKPLHTRNW